MAQNITISRAAGTRALLAALLAIVVLLVARTVKNALTAFKMVCAMLKPYRGGSGLPYYK